MAANTIKIEVVGQNSETFKGQLFFAFNLIGFGVGENTLTATTLPSSNFYWYEDGGTNPPGQASPPDPAAYINLNGNVNFSYGVGCIELCGPGASTDDTSSFEFTLTGAGLEVEDIIRSFFTDSKSAALFMGVDTQPGGARFAASYRCVDSEDPNGHMCEDDPDPNEIPEPNTLALFGAGLLAYTLCRRGRLFRA